ncbi:MAG: hypothetical protein N2506_02305, partial [Dehalococcoidales bacterium]|nr:hypothetical protein [Dehalococcoidales bacterium]
MAQEESGLEELMRLSRQFARKQQEQELMEKQRQAQGQKVKGVLQGLKELNLSLAIDQLKNTARPEIIQRVSALRHQENADDLRKLISSLAEEMEGKLRNLSATHKET